MGWALATRALTSMALPHLSPHASSAHSKRSRRINGSPSQRNHPSIAEVRRAIGIADEFSSKETPNPNSSSPSSFMDLLSSTPIGQAESPAERKIREAAEWMVDRTEANARSGQQILLTVCLKILPVWFLVLLIVSGVMKLPFDFPFLDDLIS